MTRMSRLSKECLISHLDPSLRLLMRQQCPEFAIIENKKHPVKIQNLKITNDDMTINDATYKLGFIIVFNDGKTPECILKNNSEGGVPWDIDDFGFKVDGPVLDVNSLSFYKQKLEEWKRNSNIDQKEPVTDDQRALWKKDKPEMDEMERNIMLLCLKIDNAKPMIKRYLQLLVTNKNKRTILLERWSYTKTLSEAKSHFLRKFFTGKTKIEINNFEPNSVEVMGIIMPFIEKPIGSITLFYDRELEDRARASPRAMVYDNPLIVNCEKLIVPWGRTTLHTLCSRVHYDWWLGTELFFTEMCRKERYGIGHHFSMKREIEPVKIEMNRLKDEENGFESYIPETRDTENCQCVTVELGEKEVNFYIEAIPDGETKIQYNFHGKVDPIGYATRVNQQ